MQCPRCNFENAATSMYCRQCGASLQISTPYSQPQGSQQPSVQQPPTQYPPYQPPYYQPPPYYPLPMMQPPTRKKHTWLWIVLGVIALLLFACIGFGMLATMNTQPITSSNTTNSTSTSNNPNAIGAPVVVNSDWTVTVNKVFTSTGSEFDQPKPGNILLVVNVTLQNTSSQTQNASSLAQWSIKDSTGQTYNQDITFGGGPDGTVAAGGVIRGNIAYEVPASVHNYIVQFVPGIGSSDLAEWNVSI